jgi:peptide/nickel transport system permease protein
VLAFAVRRLGAAAATTVLAATAAFALARLAPGAPMVEGAERLRADPARVAQLRARFGLDRPPAQQYARWLANAARGDLGESFVFHRPVAALVAERLPATLLLGGAALMLGFAGGIAVALAQATRAGSRTDALLGTAALTAWSVPGFWLGLLLLWAFGQVLGWLPVGGMTTPVLHERLGPAARAADVARHLVLPAVTLAVGVAAAAARFQRGALVDALRADFVRAARARGLSGRRVVLRHALRASLGPTVALAGVTVPALLAGSVLVESVFGWPGVGRLLYDAIAARDYNVITGIALLGGALVALSNLAADLAAHALDPRTAP